MLAVLRFEAADDDGSFAATAREVLALLAARPGFRSGQVARAYDQPTLWCLITEWDSVGAYRRALGSYEVRAGATPLLSRALPEPSAYEPLAVAGQGGPDTVRTRASDRASPGQGLGDQRVAAASRLRRRRGQTQLASRNGREEWQGP